MSGEIEAADKLRAALSFSGVSSAVRQAQWAQAGLREAEGLVPVMQAAVGVVVAAEALQTAGKALEINARHALAEAMALGATTIHTDAHTASLVSGARSVVITDLALIPAELMRQPPPAPDKAAIAKRIKQGEAVLGAALSNGGPDTISIRSKV